MTETDWDKAIWSLHESGRRVRIESDETQLSIVADLLDQGKVIQTWVVISWPLTPETSDAVHRLAFTTLPVYRALVRYLDAGGDLQQVSGFCEQLEPLAGITMPPQFGEVVAIDEDGDFVQYRELPNGDFIKVVEDRYTGPVTPATMARARYRQGDTACELD